MKVLFVCSGNADKISPFISEQADAIMNRNIEIEFYLIKGTGILGYLKNLSPLNKKLRDYKPDLIHAHYGLSGLLACLQFKKKVILTFHGSDANIIWVSLLSFIAGKLSDYNIVVEKKISDKLRLKNYSIIPCGVNFELFYPMNKQEARKRLNLKLTEKYILFSSAFNNKVKNYDLAKEAINKLDYDVHLIELKNYTRKEVNLLFNSVDLALLTSFSEGSPQFIKEAMACNCPIVATDIGDIKEIVGTTQGCFVTSFDPEDVAAKIRLAIDFSNTKGRTKGRETILHLDNKIIAKRILAVYQQVLENR